MVCGLTLKRQAFEPHHPKLQESLDRLANLRCRLLENVDRDAKSYQAFMAAMKLPKTTETEQAARAQALEKASQGATLVPLETAELAAEVAQLIEGVRAITIPQAASDLMVALHLSESAKTGSLDNVTANLPSIHDREWVAKIMERGQKIKPAPLAHDRKPGGA